MPAFLELKPKYILNAHRIENFQRKRIEFDPKNEEHLQVLNSCVSQFDAKYAQIQHLDSQILWGSLISLGCFIISSVSSILTTVAIGAFGYVANRIGQREQKEKEYRQSLENLVNCTHWAIGSFSGQSEDVEECSSVQQLVAALTEVTTEQQRSDIIDNSLRIRVDLRENPYRKHAHPAYGVFEDHMQEARFKLYGYGQGKVEDALSAALMAIRNWLAAIFTAPPARQYEIRKQRQDDEAEDVLSSLETGSHSPQLS